jgi:putative intracellular protease/amidase
MARHFPGILALLFTLCACASSPAKVEDSHRKVASAGEHKKVLVLISSATSIKLDSPKSTPQVPVGFYLVELGLMLREYEATTDFVFATPDGRAPTIDVNSLDLNSQIQGWSATWQAFLSAMRNVQLKDNIDIKRHIAPETVEGIRAKKKPEMDWRQKDIDVAMRHLGRLAISRPLANSNIEAAKFGEEIAPVFLGQEEKHYFSFADLIAADNDPANSLKLKDFAFVYIPGGHAPMVDFKDNPQLGEILNRFHDRNALIVAVCHGPIALQSAQYRIDNNGRAVRSSDFPLKGTRATTVSSFEELLMEDFGYFHVPSWQPTRLQYVVDKALIEAGYQMEYGSAMLPGEIQPQPGYPHIVFDESKNVLTSNGPQSVQLAVDKLKELSPP